MRHYADNNIIKAIMYFLLILTFLLYIYPVFFYIKEIKNGGNSWKTADWLINYSSGFIRRGITGEILIHINGNERFLIWILFIFQTLLYVSIFFIVIKIYFSHKRSLFFIIFILSPAFLLFSYYDLQGSFRKELIIFFVFSIFCLLYKKRYINNIYLTIILSIYIFSIFSHELTLFLFPFFAYLIQRSHNLGIINNNSKKIFIILFLIASASGLIISTLYKGGEYESFSICNDLLNRGFNPNICDGSIKFISDDFSDAYKRVISSLPYGFYYFLLLIFLSLIPIFFTDWINKKNMTFLLLAFIFMSPLYIMAIDWGRWIHIFVFFVFCIILAEDVNLRFSPGFFSYIFCFIYLTSWSIPHCCLDKKGIGPNLYQVSMSYKKNIFKVIGIKK